MFQWKNIRYHLLFDVVLMCICGITVVGVRNHDDSQKIFTVLILIYFFGGCAAFTHQLANMFSGDKKLTLLSLPLIVVYVVLGMWGFTVFMVRTFAW